MKRKILLSILAAGTVLAAATMAVNTVRADDESYRPLVQRIAERFNLDESEVQAVFDAVHEERHAEHEALFEERLTEAVSEGTITEEQKAAILAHHEEMEERMEAIRDLPEDERREARDTLHEEMKTWAEENGLDEVLGQLGPREAFGKGFRMGHMMGGR